MKAEIRFVIETSDFDFDYLDCADYKLMAKHVDDKGFKKLEVCLMEVTRIITVEDDIETIENLQYSDGAEDEFNEAVDRLVEFAKEKIK